MRFRIFFLRSPSVGLLNKDGLISKFCDQPNDWINGCVFACEFSNVKGYRIDKNDWWITLERLDHGCVFILLCFFFCLICFVLLCETFHFVTFLLLLLWKCFRYIVARLFRSNFWNSQLFFRLFSAAWFAIIRNDLCKR